MPWFTSRLSAPISSASTGIWRRRRGPPTMPRVTLSEVPDDAEVAEAGWRSRTPGRRRGCRGAVPAGRRPTRRSARSPGRGRRRPVRGGPSSALRPRRARRRPAPRGGRDRDRRRTPGTSAGSGTTRTAPPGRGVNVPLVQAFSTALPHRRRSRHDEACRLLGRHGLDDLAAAEVQQADGDRELAEHLLAEEGVEVDAGEAAQFPVRRRRPAGLVVGDHQPAVTQLEAVDDAAQRQPADLGAEAQLEPDRADVLRVLHAQVVVDEPMACGEEPRRLVVAEPEQREVGHAAVLGDRPIDGGGERRRGSAVRVRAGSPARGRGAPASRGWCARSADRPPARCWRSGTPSDRT